MSRALVPASVLLVASALAARAPAQQVLFDFNNAPLHTSLPLDVVSGGITAHLSATGQGYSIQDSTAPVFPLGFSGSDIYPNSIFAADLLIGFDHTLSAFSILYAPDELGCDDSCTMRVSAYMNGTFVGSATHTALNPGTYPVDTLACTFPQGFNSVVVHYDSPPPTCQDYGAIFLCDDMRVTPLTSSIVPFCFGDGSLAPCPCNNSGSAGHGCANSAQPGGAQLAGSGTPSVGADTLQFTTSGEPPAVLSIVFQGTTAMPHMRYGDGLRCVGTLLKRLYVRSSSQSGTLVVPVAGEPSVSQRSAALGDVLLIGAGRSYHVYYVDPSAGWCPAPQGSNFNVTNALSVTWGN